MTDLLDFETCQMIGARIAGASVRKIAELFGIAKSTVSIVMTAFVKEWKTSSLKQNSGRKRKLSDRNRQTHAGIIRKDHKCTDPNITEEFNDHHKNPGSSNIVRKDMPKATFLGRVAIRKPYKNKFVCSWYFHYIYNF